MWAERYLSKAIKKVLDETNIGDPIDFQHEIEIMHVDAPSSIIVHAMVFPPWTASIENTTW